MPLVSDPVPAPVGAAATAVIVPALNEAASIGGVVRAARSVLPGAHVIVVDDGSIDATGDEARAAGATVLRLPFNCGIGVAVQTGLRLAVAQGAERVVRLDGDGQHHASDVARLFAALEDGADCAVGSRFLAPDRDGYRPSWTRRLGIRWFARVLGWAGTSAVTDPTSGFFAANARAARFLARHYAPDYPEIDAVVRLARGGYRLVEVPVSMSPRVAGASSIGPLAALGYMLRVSVAILMSRLDPARPPDTRS
jgi:glycosyltransferase involved in cell wall biosynthesis